jgi:Tol biopolymer transport system component
MNKYTLLLIAATMTAPYAFGQDVFKKLPESPMLITEVSTELAERDLAISPDGTEMFYTQQGNQRAYSFIVYRTKNKNNVWSTPAMAPFSGKFGDLEPAFTADGKKLFFSSNRPTDGGGNPKDYDIWYVEKVGGKWSAPANAGNVVNTAADEFYPSPAANGNLYFTAEYGHGVGKEDIFVCRWENGKYLSSQPLDTAVNSKTWEFNAFVSPDEQYIFFTAYGRKGDQGGGDLYMSAKDSQGKWQSAKPLTILNSPKLDYCPFLSFDKKILFFTSGRHDIPKVFSAALTYEELMKLSHGPMNGSENIYGISFQKVLESLK